jgi:peptide/nickel transport system permease protein
MIAGGQTGIVSGQWWISTFPGLGMFLLAYALHLIADGATDDDLVRRGY